MASLLSLALLAVLLVPSTAFARTTKGPVRVGWYESPFNITDDSGRRSGYAYDYQQMIAAYTGWKYEYVEGSWSDLLQMLQEGKIDLMSDVSYTDERAERMLFSSLPMGAEEYYLFASPKNEEISAEDYATFNGKKIGANKGSVQIGFYRDWAQANDVDAQIVELTGKEQDNLAELTKGNIDMYLSLDGFFDKGFVLPVCRVGVSDFFFAVSKSRPELLPELNNAMNRIQDENPYFNQQLHAKYLQSSSVNNYLNGNEREWLASHGAIRIGYQDDYLAFCAQDETTGELTGALGEWLAGVSENIENAELEFEPVSYPTAAAAMEAMEGGEVDCVFPANLTNYDGEVRDVFLTPALTRTDVSVVVREADKQSFENKDRVTVAVDADNPNYDLFLVDHFPNWRTIYYTNVQECLKAVSEGQADCLLISTYRYNDIASLCEQLRLTTRSTGEGMDFRIAVNRNDTILYSILTKATAVVPESAVIAALTHFVMQDPKTDIADTIRSFLPVAFIGVLTVSALAILVVLFRGIWLDKNAADQGKANPTKEDFAFLDDLPISYSVYQVIQSEHSALCDAVLIYANRLFFTYGQLKDEEVVGHHVRELFPYIGEEWYKNVSKVAFEGEGVEYDYTDPLSGKRYHAAMQQVLGHGYCTITYSEA
ncbi:MAG: transporter substrate-binding domain-containing protein [Atopobiaceae bacterium]|nr:transporter substrate-binding domain-containing protein [Atopobiaceae bacterium]